MSISILEPSRLYAFDLAIADAARAEIRARAVRERARHHCVDMSEPEIYGATLTRLVLLTESAKNGLRALTDATAELVRVTDALERLLPALDAKGKR